MARKDEPSYADLAYEVLGSAGHPLTFQEIFDEVNRRRPVTTRDPKATIRGALGQGSQLVSLGDGRYGYLPHLVQGSLLRLPLTEKDPAERPLIYSHELRHALWPSFFDIEKRRTRRPIQARLPSGEEIALFLDGLGGGVWGSPMPEGLRRYLVKHRAEAGDSLLIRIDDAEAGRCEVWLEPRKKQDAAAVARRNREVADAAHQVLRKGLARELFLFVWDIVIALLARGLYRSNVASDPLEVVLRADSRFVESGLNTWMLAESMTPEREDFVRRQEEMEARLSQPAPQPLPEVAEVPSPLAFRRAMEKSLADVGRLLSKKEFSSIEEANTYLQEVLAGGGPPRRTAATPLDQALDLMYDAWEAPDTRTRVRLARKALELSPDCADAYVLLAEETARTPKDAADLYARGVAAGERALGKEAFEEAVGHFWGMVETRPYMRARSGLAQELWEMGQPREAIEHVWDMLRLNPGDNQGMRYVLLSWLLELGDDAQAKRLLGLYPNDAAAIWRYGRALHAFRTEGDTKRARKLLAEAKKWNPHVPSYLLGRKRLPRQLPETIGFGDEQEAIACAAEQLAAWRRTPGALAWLGAQAG